MESLISGAGFISETFTNDQIKSFLEKTITTENAHKILDNMTSQNFVVPISKSTSTAQEEG